MSSSNFVKTDTDIIGILRYYAGKLLILLVSMACLTVIVFCIARLTPTDPLQSYFGSRVEKMTVQEKAAARERLGLNEPIIVQFKDWLSMSLRGDFGISYKYKLPVTEVITDRLPNTLVLGGVGFLLIFIGALALGIVCAWRENSWLDRILCKLGTVTSCIPEFWLALVLILGFCVHWSLLPSSGAHTIGEDGWVDRLRHIILPLTVVVLEHLWYYAYMVRNKLLTETKSDYVMLCRAKGLSKADTMLKHCVRNVLPGYISLMAIAVAHVLGGTYIVELVFSYPGIGTLAYESARYADYNLLMILCLITGLTVIFCNMLGQVINEKIDPRIKVSNTAIVVKERVSVNTQEGGPEVVKVLAKPNNNQDERKKGSTNA